MRIKVIAIVPAAGRGKRFHTSVRKPFVEVAGVPLLIYTLKRLHAIKSITEIIPVLREEDMERGLELIEAHNLFKIKRITPGGEERQDSIYNALRLIREDGLVLIHDGVRPLISAGMIEKLLHEIKGFDGVALGLPVKETLKEVDARRFVISTVTREKFWTIQTPQVFPTRVIKKAYDKAYKDGFYATDDAALVERIGGKVKIIAGTPFNIKITTPEDLEMVKYLLTIRTEK
jgi:2-C-methyl-D-erythritol 4-phosphate cytidylyltransferase